MVSVLGPKPDVGGGGDQATRQANRQESQQRKLADNQALVTILMIFTGDALGDAVKLTGQD